MTDLNFLNEVAEIYDRLRGRVQPDDRMPYRWFMSQAFHDGLARDLEQKTGDPRAHADEGKITNLLGLPVVVSFDVHGVALLSPASFDAEAKKNRLTALNQAIRRQPNYPVGKIESPPTAAEAQT